MPAIVQDPFKHNLAWKYGYTKEDIEGYGYSFDVQVDILDGPCGGGILAPHLSEGKGWVARGALTFDKGADIRGFRYSEYFYSRKFYHEKLYDKKLNISYLEHRAHAGSLYRYDKPPKNPMLICTPEHVDFLGDEVYWLITGRSPGKSDMLYDLPKWAKAFDIDLKIVSKVDSQLEDFAKGWVPEKLKPVWLKMTSENKGMGFHFAVLVYFSFHLATTEKRRISTMHLLANIEEKPRLLSVNNHGVPSTQGLDRATMSAKKRRELRNQHKTK